jgi:hypothetical protein
MKRSLTFLPLAAIFFTAVVLISSCTTNSKSKLLLKRWVIERVDFGVSVPEESRMLLEAMINQSKKTSYFVFHEDFTFEASAIGMEAKGVWQLNDDATELFTMDKKTQREERIKIIELTADKLVLSAEAQGQPIQMTFIPDNTAAGSSEK